VQKTDEKQAALSALELCAGAGGQALGLDRAGFEHRALVENDRHACATLRSVRRWRDAVRETDLRDFRAVRYDGVDLVAGGVPCPPFSRAGRRLGDQDERDLFPEALRIVGECKPRAVMIENVRNLLGGEFADYRASVLEELAALGYSADWQLLEACDYGVPQLRPRAVLVAFRRDLGIGFPEEEEVATPGKVLFSWPEPKRTSKTVGAVLRTEMRRNGWEGAAVWASQANQIAPTLVGGSKKHGGADLGPTQAKKHWRDRLGVDALGVADTAPPPGFQGNPRLTVPMAAMLQGFPANWPFQGGKTAAYRQVGNAFPPPVAEAVGRAIADALAAADSKQLTRLAPRGDESTADASAVAA
jgi:DNA (cytosine-5)-methyltransferase 1